MHKNFRTCFNLIIHAWLVLDRSYINFLKWQCDLYFCFIELVNRKYRWKIQMIETFVSTSNLVFSKSDMYQNRNKIQQVFAFIVILTVFIVIYYKAISWPRYGLLQSFRERRNLSLIQSFNEPEVSIRAFLTFL